MICLSVSILLIDLSDVSRVNHLLNGMTEVVTDQDFAYFTCILCIVNIFFVQESQIGKYKTIFRVRSLKHCSRCTKLLSRCTKLAMRAMRQITPWDSQSN